jgi:hypothetical protein
MHRIALRERLVNIDWTRGSDVVHELRAESARALRATTSTVLAAAAASGGAGGTRSPPAAVPTPRAASQPASLAGSPTQGAALQ